MSNLAFSENSSHTPHGYVAIDQSLYKVFRNSGPMFVTISGIGDIPQGVDHEKATIIITLPDGNTSNHRIFSTKDGTFELSFPISYDSQNGTYKVFVTFAGNVLGELFFDVERQSGYIPQDKPSYALGSDITFFEIDSESYTIGSSIKLTGIIESTHLDSAVTVKIISPVGNLVVIDQLSVEDDGTFSAIIPAHGPTWNLAGNYTIEVNAGSRKLEDTFDFIIPELTPSFPISSSQTSVIKTTSVLTLQEPSEDVYRYNSSIDISVPITGYLISDGMPIVGATINFIVDGTLSNLSADTDSDGYFQTYFPNPTLDSSYQLQATYGGSSSDLPSESLTKSFTVSKINTSPPPPPQDTYWIESLIVIIIVIIIGSIIAGIVKNKKKKKLYGLSPLTSPPPPPTDKSVIFHFACLKCHAKLPRPSSSNAGQKCPSCGWES